MQEKEQEKHILSSDGFYDSGHIDTHDHYRIGHITEKEKLTTAKQILLGLATLYVLTLFVYLVRPTEGNRLLDICTTTFPPLATLILVSYFRERR